ncbi:dienelactone hydrolase family protein [Marinobacterium arenosum]|uniref:dienelactone hydrolase family protein n=1 Tax=Marinobacterium arenosum TaxID=2862496 RepID=UPI001C98D2AD|nr:dienelactone hydrolase family protein [Marinobacterium arenosum]MBY4675612.1 dienelactone hydrolase family protein [Marinobacterium arenosum]
MCDLISCNRSSDQPSRPTLSSQTRRDFLKGLICLPLAVVLADPQLARAAGQRTEQVRIELPSGQQAQAYLALPDDATERAPTVLLIHEWWGLNDQIKAVANELAEQGFIALAVDLYQGKVATSREKANEFRMALDPTWATEALVGWIDWLRQHSRSNGRVATLGWCFGGGWALDAALAAPVDATVIYYGDVRRSAEQLTSLYGPVLGHFGTLDTRIDAAMVGDFERAMAEADKTELTVHWYVADHAFANPTGARYDQEDAALSWARTLSFLHRHLRG